MNMEPIDKLINFLKGNHTWTRLYKPGEITDPISKAIEKSGENMGKTMADAMESNKAVAKIQLGQGIELSLPIATQIKGEKGEKGEKGNPGKDPDEEKIIREVLKKIVLPKDGKDADEDRIVKSILGKLKRPKDGKDAVVDYGYIVDETLKAIADEHPGWKPMTEFEIQEMIREAIPKVNGFTKADRRGIIEELKKEVQKLASNAKNVSYSLWQRAIGVKNLDDVDLTAPTNGQALTYSNGKWVNSTVSGGSGAPGGSDTQVQFNDGGSFGGDAGLTYNKTTNALTAGDVLVDDEAYDATNWNGSLEVPTKNAVRDKIESLSAGSGHAIKEAGTPLTQRAGLNFGAGFDLSDDAGNDETDVALDLSEYTGADLPVAGGGTGASTAEDARTNLGLVASGTGDIWVEKAGDAMSGNLAITIPNSGNALAATIVQNDTTNNPRAVSITNAGTATSLFVDPNGTASSSTSVGGAILLENTGNTGAGLVIYSNAGASSGRLMNIRADNVLFDQAALHIDYDGTSNAFEILQNSTDSSANAISVTSVNQNDSSVGVTGQESGKGTIKITHNKPDGVADINASALSLSLGRVNAGETSAAHGIFLDTTHVTTGKLLNLRNNGSEMMVLNADGTATFAGDVTVPDEAYGAGWNGSLEVPTKNSVYDKIETLQPLDSELTALAGLTSAANKVPMFSGSGTATLLDLDTDLASVSASDDSVPSAKATKAMGDLKLPLAGGTMSGNITLGENTSIALDPAGSADGKYSGITVTGIAGYTQAFGDLVYLDPTDSRWEAADANSAAGADGDARGLLAMVVSAGTDGNACTLLLSGIIRADAKFPTFTVNNPIYVSETAGSVTQTQPTTTDAVIRIVGAALTADEMFFRPDFTWVTPT